MKPKITVTIDLTNGKQIELGITDWHITKGSPQTLESPEEFPEIEEMELVWPETGQKITDADWDNYAEPNLTQLEDAIKEYEREHSE